MGTWIVLEACCEEEPGEVTYEVEVEGGDWFEMVPPTNCADPGFLFFNPWGPGEIPITVLYTFALGTECSAETVLVAW